MSSGKLIEPKLRSGRGSPTWEIAYLFPEQGNWTEEQYLALDTNSLVEFVDGVLEFLPVPNFDHQVIAKWLLRKFDDYVAQLEQGEVLFAPMAIRLREGLFREPDLFYLSEQRIPQGEEADPPEGADLVVEVVSPGKKSRDRDLVTKREEYAAAGIREYWIVDPRNKSITVLTLRGRKYHVHGEFREGSTATSKVLPHFSVSVDETFKRRRRRKH